MTKYGLGRPSSAFGPWSLADLMTWAAVAGSVATYLAFQVPGLSVFSYGWDEGFYLQVGWLVALGYRPHSDIFFPQATGFGWFLGALYKLLGHSVEGFRLAVVLAGVLTIVFTSLLLLREAGRVASVASAWLLALNPKFQALTRAIEADSVALPLMVLALFLTAVYRRKEPKGSAAALLAGFVLGLGSQLKLSAAVLLPAVVVGILWGGRQRDALGCVAAWALAFGSVLAMSSPVEAVSQFIVFQTRWAATYGIDLSANLRQLVGFLWVDRGMVLLALAGAVLAARRGFVYAAGLGWTCLLGAFYALKSPLYDHNLVTLVPGLAILGGLAAKGLTPEVLLLQGGRIRRSSVVVAALVTVYLVLTPRLIFLDLAVRPEDNAAWRAVAFMASNVPRGTWAISDEPMVAFRAELPSPPGLADTSYLRLATGYLPASELITTTESMRPSVVLVWGRFRQAVPDYVRWLSDNYREGWTDGQHSIFMRR